MHHSLRGLDSESEARRQESPETPISLRNLSPPPTTQLEPPLTRTSAVPVVGHVQVQAALGAEPSDLATASSPRSRPSPSIVPGATPGDVTVAAHPPATHSQTAPLTSTPTVPAPIPAAAPSSAPTNPSTQSNPQPFPRQPPSATSGKTPRQRRFRKWFTRPFPLPPLRQNLNFQLPTSRRLKRWFSLLPSLPPLPFLLPQTLRFRLPANSRLRRWFTTPPSLPSLPQAIRFRLPATSRLKSWFTSAPSLPSLSQSFRFRLPANSRLRKWFTTPPSLPSFPQTLTKKIRLPVVLLLAVLLFVLITLTAWKSDALAWPLASISTSSGILLLSILAKLTDWALLGVTDEAWLRLQWGPLLERGGDLLTFLVMDSGMQGWWKVLVASSVPGSKFADRVKRLAKIQRVDIVPGPRFWSFLRWVWCTLIARLMTVLDLGLGAADR